MGAKRRAFEKDKTVLLNVDMSPHEIDALLKWIEEKGENKFTPIFKKVGGEHDYKRLQWVVNNFKSIKCAAFRRMIKSVDFIIKRLSGYYVIKRVSILKSLEGGENQEAHRDYSTIDVIESMKMEAGDAPPLSSAILALMPDTRFRRFAFTQDEVDIGSASIVTLQPRDLLVFRGDYPHSGVGFPSTNIRVHFYIGDEDSELPEDGTYPVVWKTFYCNFCDFNSTWNSTVSNHKKKRCRENPATASNFTDSNKRKVTLWNLPAKFGKSCQCGCGVTFTDRKAYTIHNPNDFAELAVPMVSVNQAYTPVSQAAAFLNQASTLVGKASTLLLPFAESICLTAPMAELSELINSIVEKIKADTMAKNAQAAQAAQAAQDETEDKEAVSAQDDQLDTETMIDLVAQSSEEETSRKSYDHQGDTKAVAKTKKTKKKAVVKKAVVRKAKFRVDEDSDDEDSDDEDCDDQYVYSDDDESD